MDLTFVANDTRGGVEPYLALAREAAARGYTVRAAAPEDYSDEFRNLGIRFAPLLGVDREAIIARSDRASLREMSAHVVELTRGWAKIVREIADGTDVVVSGIGGMAVARPVAEVLGVPLMRAHLQPLDAPSATYAGPLAPQMNVLGPVGRRVSHVVTGAGISVLTRAPERAARESLGVSGRSGAVLPTILYGFSPAVVPVTSDATATRVATGYWSLRPAGEQSIPRHVREFVASSGPVISVGFGSMLPDDPSRLFDVVAEAIARVGVRAVVLTGWGGVDASRVNENIAVATSVPHSWLFPRVSATVHHGGAGTTGAALSAGVPTLVVPFGADQPFWGQRAEALGVAPAPVRRKRLTVDLLSRALDRMLRDTEMRNRATTLGKNLRAERGVMRAVNEIEAAAAARA